MPPPRRPKSRLTGSSLPKPGGLAIVREDEDERTILHVTGEIDIATAPELRKAIEKADRAKMLIVDLLGCSYMDSSGLEVLSRSCKARPGRIRVVVQAPGQVLRVLELTGLDRVVPIAFSIDEARG
jgi:anti-sigma B factor antagonist